ncbi:MAG: hypothetical protein LQ345_002317 [Seirophora villosa]|nr:MAG: hypothetical protein LQ345_002317 [Seirophora villosa]
MEPSPLTQQDRPSVFQPKVDSLYEQLLSSVKLSLRPNKISFLMEMQDEEDQIPLSDGFWQEFFLLRPDKSSLQRRLDSFSADDLLHIQIQTQQLFRRAVGQINSRNGTSDEAALDTLTVFLDIVLAKRYTNPSSEIITVLAGLDDVDDVFLDFANAIEYIHDLNTPIHIFEPFLLLGLLANYNKFEFRNPYRSRLEDFVDDATIQQIIRGFGALCSQSRDKYVAIQEDIQEGWTLSSTLKYIGLGVLAPSRSSTPAPNPPSRTEDTKDPFALLPDTSAAILLPSYDFINANKLYCRNLITHPADTPKSETPFSAFLSLTSYTLHHAHRSSRASLYGLLNLTTLRILTEDPTLCPKLFSPALSTSVRLCRQRAPSLPSTPSPRPLAAAILDIVTDTLTHNLRRRLDIPLYTASTGIVHRLLAHLAATGGTRFPYHWPLLWQTLLSLLRFLATYSGSLAPDPDLPALIDALLATLCLAVAAGGVFLPDNDADDKEAAHDDLFYKLVETAHVLRKFKAGFFSPSSLLPPRAAVPPTTTTTTPSHSYPPPNDSSSGTRRIDALIATTAHFERLLDEERKGKQQLGPKEVARVIRKGVESLRVDEGSMEGVERWGGRWREVEEKSMLKKVGRKAVEDARRVVRKGGL